MHAGANDTANAAGPYAAVQHMYIQGLDDCGAVSTPLWVLAFCGLGIVTVSLHMTRRFQPKIPLSALPWVSLLSLKNKHPAHSCLMEAIQVAAHQLAPMMSWMQDWHSAA